MTILNTYLFTENRTLGWFGIGITGVILIGMIIFSICERDFYEGIVPCAIFLALVVFLTIKAVPKTRIECTIDDTVSFNTVLDEYNVVSNNGMIWTLEEKGE